MSLSDISIEYPRLFLILRLCSQYKPQDRNLECNTFFSRTQILHNMYFRPHPLARQTACNFTQNVFQATPTSQANRLDPNEIIAQLKESLRQEEAKLQFLRKLKLTQAKLKERQERIAAQNQVSGSDVINDVIISKWFSPQTTIVVLLVCVFISVISLSSSLLLLCSYSVLIEGLVSSCPRY